MPLFGKAGPKNPQELVKSLKEALATLEQSAGAKKAEKVRKYCIEIMINTSLYIVRLVKNQQNSFNK